MEPAQVRVRANWLEKLSIIDQLLLEQVRMRGYSAKKTSLTGPYLYTFIVYQGVTMLLDLGASAGEIHGAS